LLLSTLERAKMGERGGGEEGGREGKREGREGRRVGAMCLRLLWTEKEMEHTRRDREGERKGRREGAPTIHACL